MNSAPSPKKAKSGSETRQRQHTLRFRANDAEKQQIQADAERAGLTVASYMRKVLLDAPVPRQGKRAPIEKQELGRLLGQIGKIGSNINQIAHAANKNIPCPDLNLGQEISDLRLVRDDIRKLLGRKVDDH